MELNWYYAIGGESIGPVSEAELRARIADGTVGPRDHVFCDGWEDWAQAQDVGELWADSSESADEVREVEESPQPIEISISGRGNGPQTMAQRLALGTLIAGILSVSCFGPIASIPGLIVGRMAIRGLTGAPEDKSWSAMAWIGIVMCGASLLIFLLPILIVIIVELL